MTDYNEPWDETTFVAFDTETTGLSSTARIVEIGFALVEKGKVTRKESQLIDPGEPIPFQASNVHKIYDEDVQGAPKFHAYLPRIVEWMCLGPWVAHNMIFDTRMLKQELQLLNKEPTDVFLSDLPTLCTLRAARLSGHKKAKLGDLARVYDIDQESTHRAGDDARVCGLLAARLYRGQPVRISATCPSARWFG